MVVRGALQVAHWHKYQVGDSMDTLMMMMLEVHILGVQGRQVTRTRLVLAFRVIQVIFYFLYTFLFVSIYIYVFEV